MLVGDGASASVARFSGRAKSSAAAYGQMQRAPFRTPSRSLCLVVQVLDAWQRMLAVMPRNLEELSEWRVVAERLGLPADAARKVDAACAVRQRFPKDATTIPGKLTDILEAACLLPWAGKVETAGARGFDEVACEQQHFWRRTRLICRGGAEC